MERRQEERRLGHRGRRQGIERERTEREGKKEQGREEDGLTVATILMSEKGLAWEQSIYPQVLSWST
jgi:hypothetical protein